MNFNVLNNLKLDENEEYYYTEKDNVIKYAAQTTTELMHLYDYYNRLYDIGLILQPTPIFNQLMFFNIYLIDLLSLPQYYNLVTESKIMDLTIPSKKDKRIPFYKCLFETINYLSNFKYIPKDIQNMNNFLNQLNCYTRNLNQHINNVKEVFQGSVCYLKSFNIKDDNISLSTNL